VAEFNQAQYGDRKRLADAGLSREDVPTQKGADAMIPGAPTGRPAGPSTGGAANPVVTGQPAGEEMLLPDDEHHRLMELYADSVSAEDIARRLQSQPGVGSWVRFLVQLAQMSKERAGLEMNNGTPNWTLD